MPKKLIALGDSGVFGWGDPLEGGWCERLRRHWMELPDGPVLYNLGVRGDGLERVSARLQAEVCCRGELRRQQPQGILLGVGLNDCARVGRPDGRHQLDPEGFLFGLQQLLPLARSIAPVFVIGQRYERLLEEACLEADAPFLPLLAGLLDDPRWESWISGDGLHLNSDGHRQIYARLRQWPALLAWAGLERLGAATPLAS